MPHNTHTYIYIYIYINNSTGKVFVGQCFHNLHNNLINVVVEYLYLLLTITNDNYNIVINITSIIILFSTKDYYYITGRANPISCAVGLR